MFIDFKDKDKIVIILFPILAIILTLFIFVIFFRDKPILINGKEFGNLKIPEYYNKINKSLDSAYLHKKGISQLQCLEIAKKYYKENNYKNIDDSSSSGQTIWANNNQITMLIRCTNDKSNILYITGYSNKQGYVTTKVDEAQSYFKNEIKKILAENKNNIIHYSQYWLSNFTNLNKNLCMSNYKKIFKNNHIKIDNDNTSIEYGFIYGKKNYNRYLVFCSDNYTSLVLTGNNSKELKNERRKLKAEFKSLQNIPIMAHPAN